MQHLAPASVRIQEAPPNAVLLHVLHTPAPVQESRKHTLSELDDARILFCLCRLSRVIGERVLFGDWWDDESRMKSYKRCAERGEL